MEKNSLKGLLVWGMLIAVFTFGINLVTRGLYNNMTKGYNATEFQRELEAGIIRNVEIQQNAEVPTGVVRVALTNGTQKAFFTSDVNEIEGILQNYSGDEAVSYSVADVKRKSLLEELLPSIILGLIVLAVLAVLVTSRSSGAGANKMMNFGKSRARLTMQDENKMGFKDVAGLAEEKAELEEVVDFLRNPKKYVALGARIPKGIILVGPPGTGKTLMAKAVAGEASVPFFSISGSDFVEMYVGVGASRVRDLFAEAKKNAPCIIFIDEIDAVARVRGSGMGGGHDEREQTLNQMLVEMDGFSVNEGIIVLAATNRVDILDPAILRPVRFDRQIAVNGPDVKGREEILQVHTKNKPLAEDVDLHEIARTTAGFVGADLENLMNEAAILAAKENRSYVMKQDIDKAFIKVGIGTEKRSRHVSERDRKITAYHEAGHAILFHLLPDIGPVYTVSIIPTGVGAGGYTMPLPERDDMFTTRGQMLQEIQAGLGGRIAEEMIFGDYTTGASQDIKTVTKQARAMVMKYGMSERLGLINYESQSHDDIYGGRDSSRTALSQNTTMVIDEEVKRIVDECYAKARDILEANVDVMHRIVEELMEKERIDQKEFEAIFSR